MRLLFRVLGWLIVGVGLVLAARDVLISREDGAWSFQPLGEIWFKLHPGSLNLLQAVTERYVSEALWFSVIQPALEAPAFVFFLVLGLIVLIATLLIGRKKDERRRRH